MKLPWPSSTIAMPGAAKQSLRNCVLICASPAPVCPGLQWTRSSRRLRARQGITCRRNSSPSGGETLSPISGDGWDGADEWPALQHHESLLQLWRTVLSAGRESEIHGGELIQLPGTPIQAGVASLDRVVAIPLDVRGATRGVLMAGMPRSEDSGEDFSRLESYGLLAAAALDREAAREERAASGAALRTMVEGSTESLILIDGNGSIVGAAGSCRDSASAPARVRQTGSG